MTSFLSKGFVIALILVAGIFCYVLAHEGTHLFLADEADGICIGRCRYSSPEVVPSSGFAFGTASGVHNGLSLGEFWPVVVGLVVLFGVVFGGMVCFLCECDG